MFEMVDGLLLSFFHDHYIYIAIYPPLEKSLKPCLIASEFHNLQKGFYWHYNNAFRISIDCESKSNIIGNGLSIPNEK